MLQLSKILEDMSTEFREELKKYQFSCKTEQHILQAFMKASNKMMERHYYKPSEPRLKKD